MGLKTARRGAIEKMLVNPYRNIIKIVARYTMVLNREKFKIDAPPRKRGSIRTTLIPYRGLHPVGISKMPSQSVHIPEDLYEYVLGTKAEDQSTSKRVCELMRKGRNVEEGDQ